MPATTKKKHKPSRTRPVEAPASSSNGLAFDGILFDIDNVLINTHHSYFDAIRWTIEIYLTHGSVPFFQPVKKSSDPQLLTANDVAQFKLLGGFNDDWDCCYGLLVYLLSLPVKKRDTKSLKAVIDIKKFAKGIKKKPLQVSGIVNKLGRPAGITIEKISRIFQEVYLGKDLFKKLEGKRSVYWKKQGLIKKEKLIFRPSTLGKLKTLGLHMGIATGRPRFEALFALKRFGIIDYFDAMTTINEVRKAEQEMKRSLRKPHPFSIIATAQKIGQKKRYAYIGDLPDDISAANRAKISLNIASIAFPWYAANPKAALEEAQKSQPDYLLEKPGDLPRLIRHPDSFQA